MPSFFHYFNMVYYIEIAGGIQGEKIEEKNNSHMVFVELSAHFTCDSRKFFGIGGSVWSGIESDSCITYFFYIILVCIYYFLYTCYDVYP